MGPVVVARVIGGRPPGWLIAPGCNVIGGRAPGPCWGCSVMGGNGVLAACVVGSGFEMGGANPGGGVTGRSLGRCRTAAFTCGWPSVGVVVLLAFWLSLA